MPQALAFAASAFLGGTAVAGVTAGAFAIFAAQVVTLGVLGAASRHLAKKRVKKVEATSGPIERTVRSTIAPQTIIYGKAMVGGVTVYNNAVGVGNRNLYHIIAFAGHECASLSALQLDDRMIDFAVDSHSWDPVGKSGNGKVETGEFRGNSLEVGPTHFRWYRGDQTSADIFASTQIPEWTLNHIGAGHAYGVLQIIQIGTNEDNNVSRIFQRGFPNNVRGLWLGKKVYDPRSDSPGTHRVDSEGTWEWSDNPALCVADYLRDTNLGLGESYSNVYYPSVHSAAEYCDTVVNDPSGTHARFTCNGAIHTGNTHAANLKSLLSSFNGTLTWTQSGWHVLAGWEVPTVTLNKSDLSGGPRIQRRARSTRERFNHVRGTFVDPNNYYRENSFPTVSAAEFIARDNSQDLFTEISLPMTNDVWEAQRVAFGVLEQGDNQLVAKFPLKFPGIRLMPGKTVSFDFDVLSWSGQTFRMTDLEFSPERGIELVCHEDYQSRYTDPGTSEYFSPTDTGLIVDSPFVPSISSVTILQEVHANVLRWVNPAARLWEYVDIYHNDVTNDLSDSNTKFDSVRTNEFTHVTERGNVAVNYWLRARDFADNVSSFFPNTQSTTIIGITRFPVFQDPDHVFLEEFNYSNVDQFDREWEELSGNPTTGITFPQTGTLGGQSLRADSHAVWRGSKVRVPYDDYVTYEMTAGVRVTRNPTVGVANGSGEWVYFGINGFDASKNPINVAGDSSYTSQHFFTRRAWNQVTSGGGLNVWNEYSGHIQGHMADPRSGSVYENISHDPAVAARAQNAVRYISPMFILNYNDGNGAMELDYIKLRKAFARNIVYNPEITIESNWLNLGRTTETDSLNMLTADPAIMVYTEVGSEFNTLTVSDVNVITITERARPGFHLRVPAVNSTAFNLNAMVYVSSQADGDIDVFPTVTFYTRNGSHAVRSIGSPGFTSSADFETDKWAPLSLRIDVPNLQPASLNPDSYPPPYFASFGLSFGYRNGATVANCLFVSAIDAEQIL